MNTGQMLLVIGAFTLLTTLSASVSRTLMDSDRTQVEARIGTMAVSICQGEIDRLVTTDFDSLQLGATVDTITTGLASFVCSTHVGYVTDAAPEVLVAGPTRFKRVDAVTRSAYMPGTATLRAVAGDF